MRGTDPRQEGMFSYISPEARVPGDHPLRAIRKMVNTALEGLTKEFEAMYSHTGRPSIAPKQLLGVAASGEVVLVSWTGWRSR